MAVAAIGISGLGLVGFLGLSFLKDYIAKRQGLNIIHDEGERAVNLEHTTPDIVDIVCVHGLGGHPEKTWTYNSQYSKTNWVKDILPYDLRENCDTRARIMTYGYQSEAKFSKYFPQTLSMHSHRLVAQLAERRGEKYKDRPIIFVAHSLGGLIVKSALVYASASNADSDTRLKSLQLSTIGVLYFGTPQREGRNLKWDGLLSRVMSISRIISVKTRFDSLSLQAELFELELGRYRSIEDKFLNFSFYETLTTKGIDGRNALHAVPKELALPPIQRACWHIRELKKNHEGLVKFESRTDPEYARVFDALRNCLEHTRDAARNCKAFEREADFSQNQETILWRSKSKYTSDGMSLSWRAESFTSATISSATSTVLERIKSHEQELSHKHFGQERYNYNVSRVAAELAQLYNDTNQHKKAESLYQRLVTMTKKELDRSEEAHSYHDGKTLRIMAELARLYLAAGHHEKAQSLNKRLLVETQELYGYFSPERAYILNQLAHNVYLQGDYAEAADLLLHVQKIQILWYDGGKKHRETLRTTARLAIIFDQQGKFDDAQQLYQEVIESREAASDIGHDHEDTIKTIENLALSYRLQKPSALPKAAQMYKEALERRRRVLHRMRISANIPRNTASSEHSDDIDDAMHRVADTSARLVDVYRKMGKLDLAKSIQIEMSSGVNKVDSVQGLESEVSTEMGGQDPVHNSQPSVSESMEDVATGQKSHSEVTREINTKDLAGLGALFAGTSLLKSQ